MKIRIYKAHNRGTADYGWLKANYSFSFANYFNPQMHNFGKLRVLNDDYIAPSKGFDTHQHDNMEIITIPLTGAIEHKDSMGSAQIIRKNDVQFMSAGTGVFHSEFSAYADGMSNILQIWIYPKIKNISPKYLQITLDPKKRKNKLDTFISPTEDTPLTINQDAFLSLSDLDRNNELEYNLKIDGNGIYIFVIEGQIEINGDILSRRDAIGITEAERIKLTALENSELLFIEVPVK